MDKKNRISPKFPCESFEIPFEFFEKERVAFEKEKREKTRPKRLSIFFRRGNDQKVEFDEQIILIISL